jgi:hypothetical protein
VRDRSSDEYKQAIVRELACSTLSDHKFALTEGGTLSTLHKTIKGGDTKR